MLFDDVLAQVGKFSKFQLRCFLLINYENFMIGFGVVMLPVFILTTPEHRCTIPGINDTWVVQNDEHERLINLTIPLGSKCTFYDIQDNGTEKSCNQWVYDDEIFKPSAAMEFNIVCDRKMLRSFAYMVYYLGLLVGGLVGGRLSDRFGRKMVTCVSVFPLITASIGMSFSPNIFVLMACRFIQAMSGMSYTAASFVSLLELTGPSRRHLIAPFSDLIFAAGYVLMTLPAYYIRNWRYLTLTVSMFQIPLVGLWWLIPESPRWLLTKNRKEEANVIIQKAARINGKQIQPDILDHVDVIVPKKDSNLWRLFKYKTTCLRLGILAVNWAAVSTVYHGLALNAGELSGNIFVNITLSAATEIPAFFFIIFTPMKFGRKKTHCFSFLLGGTSCLATILVVFFGGDVTWAYQLLATVGKFGATAGFTSVYNYTAELHPTSLRSLSIGICSMCARIATLCAPFISDLGEYIPGRFSEAMPLIVFGLLTVTAGLASLFLPETQGRPLPATIGEARNFKRKDKKKKRTENEVTEGKNGLVQLDFLGDGEK